MTSARVETLAAAGVVAWLRSPEGEEWSRSRTLERVEGDPVVCPNPQTSWRVTGPLNAGSDPCGRPPVPAVPVAWNTRQKGTPA